MIRLATVQNTLATAPGMAGVGDRLPLQAKGDEAATQLRTIAGHAAALRPANLALIAVMLIYPAYGQAADLSNWDNLTRLRAGQRVAVIEMNLKRTEGAWVGFSTDALSVRVEGSAVSISRSNVFRISSLANSKRPRNALVGLAIGCAAGLAFGAALDSSFSEEDEHIGKTIFTPIGCGAGAGVGAAISGFETVYRAAKAARTAPGGGASSNTGERRLQPAQAR